mmetsp:Transcript_20088/g.40971  ORF Transcript_20088/g.40971 Transcript_20088/m.40971 type:complete len:295 (+) Transcript_20088:97-981(+)
MIMRLALLALCATLCASAANHSTYEPDAGWPSTPGIDATYFEELYQKYAKELKEILSEARAFCARPGVWCLSDQLEIEMSYMRVREAKPALLFEISPSKGYSTFWLLNALERNGNGVMVSFDIQNLSMPELPLRFTSNRTLYTFVLGDVMAMLPSVLRRTGPPNYAYLDSFHSKRFGCFFQTQLLEKMPRGSFVSAHDIYHSAFYTDEKPGRDLSAHPPDQPTEEGMALQQWLMFSSRGLRVFTMSSSAKTPHQSWACEARHRVLSFRNTVRKLHKLNENGCGGTDPTLYFELA